MEISLSQGQIVYIINCIELAQHYDDGGDERPPLSDSLVYDLLDLLKSKVPECELKEE